MPSRRLAGVDAPRASLSFAPLDRPDGAPSPATCSRLPTPKMGRRHAPPRRRLRVVVGASDPAWSRSCPREGTSGRCPSTRSTSEGPGAAAARDILARDRLLDWLSVKVHNRVVLLTAEAGYGKTTLLADFARRTDCGSCGSASTMAIGTGSGSSPIWSRRFGSTFPASGRRRHRCSARPDPRQPSRESVLDTFLRELGGAAGRARGPRLRRLPSRRRRRGRSAHREGAHRPRARAAVVRLRQPADAARSPRAPPSPRRGRRARDR